MNNICVYIYIYGESEVGYIYGSLLFIVRSCDDNITADKPTKTNNSLKVKLFRDLKYGRIYAERANHILSQLKDVCLVSLILSIVFLID